MSDYRLTTEDEYPHAVSSHQNFNESVYVNGIDHENRTGAWMRLGNRVNEGYAELQMCIYLPDGRLACQFQRPAIDTNERFEAGGLRYEVKKPFSEVDMQYSGEVMVLDDLELLREPKKLFTSTESVECEISMSQLALSNIHGGEPVDDRQPTMYGRDFSLGHFFQHMKSKAAIRIGAEKFSIDGYGWRDHSWGPRYWTNINFYRLLIVNFDNGNGFTMLKITDAAGATRRCGVMNIGGQLEEIVDVDLMTKWSSKMDPESIELGIRTENRAEVMHGQVRALAPLRNRRKVEGKLLETRIAEGFTEWAWDGVRGFGLSEYIERLEGGVPVGYPM